MTIQKINIAARPQVLTRPPADYKRWAACPLTCDGLNNGYSRFVNVNPSGNRAVAFGTSPDQAWLIELPSGRIIANIEVEHYWDARVIPVGFGNNLRWWTDTTMICHILNRTMEFELSTGRVVGSHEWPSGNVLVENHCAYGQGMIGARVPDPKGIALKTLNIRNGWENAVEHHAGWDVYEFAISPSGKYIAYGWGVHDKPLEVRNAEYPDEFIGATPELAPQSGHWAWQMDDDGDECLAYWSSQTDHMHLWLPGQKASRKLCTMTDLNGPITGIGLGTHIATGIENGWGWMTTFAADDPTQENRGIAFRVSFVDPPLLIDAGDLGNDWIREVPKDYGYFSEGWACIVRIGDRYYAIYGSNQGGTEQPALTWWDVTEALYALAVESEPLPGDPEPEPEPSDGRDWMTAAADLLSWIPDKHATDGIGRRLVDADGQPFYAAHYLPADLVDDLRAELEGRA